MKRLTYHLQSPAFRYSSGLTPSNQENSRHANRASSRPKKRPFSTHLSETGDDGLWVDFERDESLGLLEQFAGEDNDGGGAVADFVVLNFGDVYENFGGGIVDADGLQDGRSVVRNLRVGTAIQFARKAFPQG